MSNVIRRPVSAVSTEARASEAEAVEHHVSDMGDRLCTIDVPDRDHAVARVPIEDTDHSQSILRYGLGNDLGRAHAGPLAYTVRDDLTDYTGVRAMLAADALARSRHSPHFPLVATVHDCGGARYSVVMEDFDGTLDALISADAGVALGDMLLANITFQVLHALAAAQRHAGLRDADVRLGNVLYKRVQDEGYWTYRIDNQVYYLKNRGLLLALMLVPPTRAAPPRSSAGCLLYAPRTLAYEPVPPTGAVPRALSMVDRGHPVVDVDTDGEFFQLLRRTRAHPPSDATDALRALYTGEFSYTRRPTGERELEAFRI